MLTILVLPLVRDDLVSPLGLSSTLVEIRVKIRRFSVKFFLLRSLNLCLPTNIP